MRRAQLIGMTAMVSTILPVHATLLDPATGAPLRALGVRKDGRPVWPAMGGADDDGDSDDSDGSDDGDGSDDDQDDDGKPLAAGGVKALKAERAKAAAAEKRAAAAEQKLADAEKAKLGEKERAEVERDEARKERDEARAEATRLRVGAKYGLSPEDVADLSTAGTEEDFDKRAKRLSERLGAKPGNKNGLPPSPNAHRNQQKTGGGAAGLEEAQRRWPQKTA
jgi:hypothetical protein